MHARADRSWLSMVTDHATMHVDGAYVTQGRFLLGLQHASFSLAEFIPKPKPPTSGVHARRFVLGYIISTGTCVVVSNLLLEHAFGAKASW